MQTGSGKTYTMGTNFPGAAAAASAGDNSDAAAAVMVDQAPACVAEDESLGVIPRLVADILDGLRAMGDAGAAAAGISGSGSGSCVLSARLTGTYLEIYNEVVRDLLRPDGVPAPAGGHPLVKDR